VHRRGSNSTGFAAGASTVHETGCSGSTRSAWWIRLSRHFRASVQLRDRSRLPPRRTAWYRANRRVLISQRLHRPRMMPFASRRCFTPRAATWLSMFLSLLSRRGIHDGRFRTASAGTLVEAGLVEHAESLSYLPAGRNSTRGCLLRVATCGIDAVMIQVKLNTSRARSSAPRACQRDVLVAGVGDLAARELACYEKAPSVSPR